MGVFDYYTVFSIRFQVVKVRHIEFAAKNICSYCFYCYIILWWLWQALMVGGVEGLVVCGFDEFRCAGTGEVPGTTEA